jgi:hypothetical protein
VCVGACASLFGSKAFAKQPHSRISALSHKGMATEVKFKYPQPFTWAQAMDLDIGTISQGAQVTTLTGSSQ